MLRYLLRRLAHTLPIVWLVATLVFGLLHWVPGDPVATLLGEGAAPADAAALRARLGLDRPLLAQYAAFLSGAARGELGTSLRSGDAVGALLADRWPATGELAAASLLGALLLALPLGVLAAARPGGAADRVAAGLALLGASLPTFWVGPVLILALGIELDLLPISGRGGWANVVLPALTLGLGIAGLLVRMVRTALAEELARPYILVARAKGLGTARTLLRHGLRNAVPPVITVVALQFGALLSGAVVVETVFSWPGLGRLMVDAIRARDYPVVQGVVLCVAATYVVANLSADLLCAWADPRLRRPS